jgi:hypothetical protein
VTKAPAEPPPTVVAAEPAPKPTVTAPVTPRPVTAPPKRRREPDEETAAPPAGAKGTFGEAGECTITIGSRPWSEVWIDGKNTTKHTPIADLRVPCGRHRLGFKRPDLQIDKTETITVRSGEKFKQVYTLTKEADF